MVKKKSNKNFDLKNYFNKENIKVILFFFLIIFLIVLSSFNFFKNFFSSKNNISENLINDNSFDEINNKNISNLNIINLNHSNNGFINNSYILNKTFNYSMNSIVLILDGLYYNGTYYLKFFSDIKIPEDHLCQLSFFDISGFKIFNKTIIVPKKSEIVFVKLNEFDSRISDGDFRVYYSCSIY